MDHPVTLSTALLVFAFTAVYIALYFIVVIKIIRGPQRKRRQFKQEAIRDGRQVFAALLKWKEFEDRDEDGNIRDTTYVGKYVYTGIDGKERELKSRFPCMPPDKVPVYLDPVNPHKFYREGKISTGRHPAVTTLLPLVIGFFIYVLLVKFLFLR